MVPRDSLFGGFPQEREKMDKATEYSVKRLEEIRVAEKNPDLNGLSELEAFIQGELVRAYKQGYADATKRETSECQHIWAADRRGEPMKCIHCGSGR